MAPSLTSAFGKTPSAVRRGNEPFWRIMELLCTSASGEYSSVIITTRRDSPAALPLAERHFNTRTLEQLDSSAIFYSFTCDPIVVGLRFILDVDKIGFPSTPKRLLTASFVSVGESVFVGGIMGLDFAHSRSFHLLPGQYKVLCGGYRLGCRCMETELPLEALFDFEHHLFLFQPEETA